MESDESSDVAKNKQKMRQMNPEIYLVGCF